MVGSTSRRAARTSAAVESSIDSGSGWNIAADLKTTGEIAKKTTAARCRISRPGQRSRTSTRSRSTSVETAASAFGQLADPFGVVEPEPIAELEADAADGEEARAVCSSSRSRPGDARLHRPARVVERLLRVVAGDRGIDRAFRTAMTATAAITPMSPWGGVPA